MEARGAFWPTFLLAPVLGPWVVMAFMRYAQVPQRRIALPVLLGILATATILAWPPISFPIRACWIGRSVE